MKPRDLIETARDLAEFGPRRLTQANMRRRGRPTQAYLRRAVSTAYFAVFHALARTAADTLSGKKHGAAWHQVYRALEHGNATKACENKKAMQEFPLAIQEFADSFVALQSERHLADYALEERYYKHRALLLIASAESAINKLESVDKQDRRDFVARVLFRKRPARRPK